MLGLVILNANNLIDASMNVEPSLLLPEFAIFELGKVKKVLSEGQHDF